MASNAVERAEAGGSQPEAAEVLDPIAELGEMALAEDAEAQPADGDEHDEETETAEAPVDADEDAEEEGEEPSDEEADKTADAEKPKDRWQKRVDTLTFKLKSEQEAAAAAKAEAEAAAARASAAEERSAAGIPLPAEYLKPDELALVREGNSLMDRREFLLRHISSGYDDPKDEAKSLSAGDVAEELVRLERSAWKIQEAQSVYRKAHAAMLEDMRSGRELRLARAKAKPKTTPKPAVAASVPAGGGRKPVTAVPSRGGVNLKRFEERGGDADAAAAELAELTGAID
jgi:hypothetical protein